MKITAIRIRKLVSRATGYGHDAAEIERRLRALAPEPQS